MHTKSRKESKISITSFPEPVQEILKVFDVDGDGTIDPDELSVAACRFKDQQRTTSLMKKALCVSLCLLLLLITCNFATSFVASEALKDTKVLSTDEDNVPTSMFVDKKTNSLLSTASTAVHKDLLQVDHTKHNQYGRLDQVHISQGNSFLTLSVSGIHMYNSTNSDIFLDAGYTLHVLNGNAFLSRGVQIMPFSAGRQLQVGEMIGGMIGTAAGSYVKQKATGWVQPIISWAGSAIINWFG